MKIALGLGCDRNTPIGTLRAAITAALGVSRERMGDIAAVGSITTANVGFENTVRNIEAAKSSSFLRSTFAS